jgi:hypothetical protein
MPSVFVNWTEACGVRMLVSGDQMSLPTTTVRHAETRSHIRPEGAIGVHEVGCIAALLDEDHLIDSLVDDQLVTHELIRYLLLISA